MKNAVTFKTRRFNVYLLTLRTLSRVVYPVFTMDEPYRCALRATSAMANDGDKSAEHAENTITSPIEFSLPIGSQKCAKSMPYTLFFLSWCTATMKHDYCSAFLIDGAAGFGSRCTKLMAQTNLVLTKKSPGITIFCLLPYFE